MSALYNFLKMSYLEWVPAKITSKIVEPVPPKLAEIFKPTLEQLLGYFEELINKMVAYKVFGQPENSDDQLELEYEARRTGTAMKPNKDKMSKFISLNFTGSEATAIQDGLDMTQPSFRKYTEKVCKFYPGIRLYSAARNGVHNRERKEA